MNLQKFPLDSQTCPLEIGSFGHDASDIVYKVRFCLYVSYEAQSTLILRANKIKSAITSYLDRTQCRRVVEAAVDFLIDRFRPKKPNFFTKVLNYIHVKYYFTNNWI